MKVCLPVWVFNHSSIGHVALNVINDLRCPFDPHLELFKVQASFMPDITFNECLMERGKKKGLGLGGGAWNKKI